ncbi:prolyl-tRNA synthetase [Spiroplasma syrphidicola EA-1]|uniref:Proline--tRNA ligase n=1 Tax=Spiroplasma syrphidicola EA-1 TaxID=1276229 RepID=R4U775_9MOLU|nr:proline--tRNA ligase [Spiroplasma syrphidicola]AGM26503.1 prolyl-tRNA synthetase [Spiroplasma syrphidicola EA-1]
MSKKLDKITPRSVDFPQWYTDIVLNADLISYGPVKGTIIFKPYGYAIWEHIQQILDGEFKKLKVKNVYFPLLIPKSLFNKEKDHIEGFAPEVATVTKVGDKVLDEELYIRPTSEVLFGTFFSKEIQGYRDLPLLYNQWVNVLRWEKTTRPFLRTSEFLWQEGHTVHSSAQEAQDFTLKILNLYAKFAEETLLLPVIKGQKTEFEKFAGADKTYTIEALMYDGQALQCGTSHYFGQNFTKPFDIKFSNKENQLEYAYSTSWGVSTRLIGGIIMSHSDDSGLVLPPAIAPIQVMIVPIKNDEQLTTVSNEVIAALTNYRCEIDFSDKSYGFKAANTEIKGIPLRIEIGPRDLAENKVTIVRRDNFEKIPVLLADIPTVVDKLLKEISVNLYERALNNRDANTKRLNTFAEYKAALNAGNGLYLAPFCGKITCEEKIKAETQTTTRCIPFGIEQEKAKCFYCQSDSELIVYFARSY